MDDLICICGTPASQHYDKDHLFLQRTDGFKSATLPRGAHYALTGLNPATQLYITVEDRCRVQIVNSVAGVEVDVTARIQLPNGEVIPMRQQFFPASTRALITFELDLTEGFLLDVAVTTPTAAIHVGNTFVLVQIIRSTGANAIPSRTLISNYVSTGLSLGWPEGPNQQSVQGTGAVSSFVVANPAAGSDIAVSVPTGARWLMQSFAGQLVTSAAVANRIPHIVISDIGGNQLWNVAAPAAQVASTTVRYSACGGVAVSSNDNATIMPIPDVALNFQGFSFNTLTTGLQAGDQWQNIRISIVEWLEL